MVYAGHLLDEQLHIRGLLWSGAAEVLHHWHETLIMAKAQSDELNSLAIAVMSRLVADPELITPVEEDDSVLRPPAEWLDGLFFDIWVIFCELQAGSHTLHACRKGWSCLTAVMHLHVEHLMHAVHLSHCHPGTGTHCNTLNCTSCMLGIRAIVILDQEYTVSCFAPLACSTSEPLSSWLRNTL